MVVIQWTFLPGPRGLRPLVALLQSARRAWIDCNTADPGGRILTTYSGLPRCAVWELHAPTLADHDEARARWTRTADQTLDTLSEMAANDCHRVFTVVGHQDEQEPVRSTGVVVQAVYTPAHGMRQQAQDLLREWQRDWADVHARPLRGRVLGFFSTGLTHELIWQCECASAAAYDRMYRGWSLSAEFDDWAKRFRVAVVSNNHGIFQIVSD